MKEILISIQPKWVAKILDGKKTIEIRKTMPKCELPCKVYIYCTYGKGLVEFNHDIMPNFLVDFKVTKTNNNYRNFVNGKVVAEFTLNEVETIKENQIYNSKVMLEHACLTIEELNNYAKDKKFYAWHIDDLKIYDEPKELSELGISKAPQSWCYVEEV